MDNALVDIFIHPSKHNKTLAKSDTKHQTRSSNSKDRHRERLRKRSITSDPTVIPSSPTRTTILERTASAPIVPSQGEPQIAIIGEGHAHRDSITSIRDDPFFKNYQTPQAISLARELRAATYTENPRNEGGSSAREKMEESHNKNVCCSRSNCTVHKEGQWLMSFMV